MELTQEMSKVEVKGFEARHYDRLMDLVTLGTYPFFIRRAIGDLGLKEGDRILDMGAGTGRNAALMVRYIGEEGRIVALEIGKEMKEQFERRCSSCPNVELIDQPIDRPFDLGEAFDFVFLSFVLHGFVQERREIIIRNAYNHLLFGGTLAILDYANFDLDRANPLVRWFIRKVECPLAEDFIRRDTKEMLRSFGFKRFQNHFYYGGYIRLLKAIK
ncbi:MAG: methyltransferase domain-containing protein [Epsilonproteobacteria bacterium]|nr:methyltransferase type 11 [Campylobacterota bacterium]NPA57126.1 methyltransferase domain-containing protein [Campylobacterota bacterium]